MKPPSEAEFQAAKEFVHRREVRIELERIQTRARKFARSVRAAVLKRVREVRRLLRREADPTDIADRMGPLRALIIQTELETFRPKGRGLDPITKLIDQALRFGLRSTDEIFLWIQEHAPAGLIETIDMDRSIEWRAKRGPRTMTFKTFQNKVSDRKKAL